MCIPFSSATSAATALRRLSATGRKDHPWRARFCKFLLTSVHIPRIGFNTSFFSFCKNLLPLPPLKQPVLYKLPGRQPADDLQECLFRTLKQTISGADMHYISTRYGLNQSAKQSVSHGGGEDIGMNYSANGCLSTYYPNREKLRFSAQNCSPWISERFSGVYDDENLTSPTAIYVFLYNGCAALRCRHIIIRHRHDSTKACISPACSSALCNSLSWARVRTRLCSSYCVL